jgi:photosystem II stability/assembly factor-like uncharacterized protein
LYFTNNSIGYLTTSIYGPPGGSAIYKTLDGGNSWTQTNSYPSIPTLQDMSFTNENTGFIVGYSGRMLKTNNAGLTWSSEQLPFVETLISVSFPSETVGYATGYSSVSGSEVIKTSDGGNTWQQLATGGQFNSALRTISFSTDEVGFAAGENGRIISTVDGGTTWQTSFSPVNETFYASKFVNPTLGFLAGTNGTLLKTNGDIVVTVFEQELFDLKIFPNPSTDGVIIESTELANKKLYISLKNSLGQVIKNEEITFLGSHKVLLDELSEAVYFLSLSIGQELVNVKILIEK